MTCKKCQNQLITVFTKCDDNIEVRGAWPKAPADILGFKYDGSIFSISYCIWCGTVDGTFPIINYAEAEVEQSLPPVVYLGDMVEQFYELVLKSEFQAADSIMRKLSVRISPIDGNALYNAWTTYESIRQIHPVYPEFAELVKDIIKRYKTVRYV